MEIIQSFINSEEFASRYAGIIEGNSNEISNEQYIRSLYLALLEREPDSQGLAGWLQALEEGMSRSRVEQLLKQSEEYLNMPVEQ